VTTGLFQPSHLLVLLVVVLVIFGPKRLPELGRSFGQGLRALKSGLDGHPDEADKSDPRTDKPDRSTTS
jgi:sec-independent protein translocase protein TatA